jgi:hypothetical protein
VKFAAIHRIAAEHRRSGRGREYGGKYFIDLYIIMHRKGKKGKNCLLVTGKISWRGRRAGCLSQAESHGLHPADGLKSAYHNNVHSCHFGAAIAA